MPTRAKAAWVSVQPRASRVDDNVIPMLYHTKPIMRDPSALCGVFLAYECVTDKVIVGRIDFDRVEHIHCANEKVNRYYAQVLTHIPSRSPGEGTYNRAVAKAGGVNGVWIEITLARTIGSCSTSIVCRDLVLAG